MVNEPSVFKLLRFNCICYGYSLFDIFKYPIHVFWWRVILNWSEPCNKYFGSRYVCEHVLKECNVDPHKIKLATLEPLYKMIQYQMVQILDSLTHCRLKRLSPHNTLEESNFNFRDVWLCDLDIPIEKWLNYLQTVETLIRCCIMRHLIWVCTVCQLPC